MVVVFKYFLLKIITNPFYMVKLIYNIIILRTVQNRGFHKYYIFYKKRE